jgi:hypothetical protein
MMNDYEAKARAVKVAKLVNGATFCNDVMVEARTDWPNTHAEGLRKLADLLASPCGAERLWALIAVPANVATEPSDRTKELVVLALRARAEEHDDAFAGLAPAAGF